MKKILLITILFSIFSQLALAEVTEVVGVAVQSCSDTGWNDGCSGERDAVRRRRLKRSSLEAAKRVARAKCLDLGGFLGRRIDSNAYCSIARHRYGVRLLCTANVVFECRF